MAMALTEDQAALREAARDFLTDKAGFERLRKTIESEAGWDEELWQGFAVEMGFAGAGIAEADGGIGLGVLEQSLIMEELGRVLAAIPWFESVVLAGGILAASETPRRAEWLGGIASGETIATLAMRSAAGSPIPDGIGPVITSSGDEWSLSGEAHYVPFGHVATLLLVAARNEGTTGWDGITLLAIPADSAGVSVTRQTSLDLTRPYATISFDNAKVASDAIVGQPGDGGKALRTALTRAAALLSAEQLGGAARSLQETVAYSKERIQFGRPIGSFQAVKHRLADMKLMVDSARTAADWAVRSLESGDETETAAAGARTYCSDAFLHCAGDAIQLHGGIGFTWEHQAHLFFKRARASATLLDPPAHHRETIARHLFDDQQEAA
ncbi:acyl-CoA dehydrogenase family protein [Pacificimonas sp. ICDLI1SI03]